MEYNLEELCVKKESQTYERKSARKEPKGFSNHIVAFANADGGMLVIGVEDDGTVTGIDEYQDNVNDILRVPFDFCKPSIAVVTETIACTDKNGNPNHLLIMTIPQSSEMHANQQDEVYYRMGDKSQKLNFDERLQLMYAKGTRYYEDEPVADSTIEDIDMEFVSAHCKKIGYSKSAEEYIHQNKDFIVRKNGREEMSGAAILLFGKEIIINAIAHRDYSIKGTDIQIKMFDDRIVVESPGVLPGIVRLHNMRTVHFSRNPKIAEFLHEYEYVQEFGEGVDRMHKEMKNAGLPAPEYRDVSFMLHATIRNGEVNDTINDTINLTVFEKQVLDEIRKDTLVTKEKLCTITSVSQSTVSRAIKSLKEKGLIQRIGARKTGYWKVL